MPWVRKPGTANHFDEKTDKMKYTIVVQEWEESELGWGVRPDGASLHLSNEDLEAFKKAFWDKESKRNPSPPPEYSRPSGKPFLMEVEEDLYQRIQLNTPGIWLLTMEWEEIQSKIKVKEMIEKNEGNSREGLAIPSMRALLQQKAENFQKSRKSQILAREQDRVLREITAAAEQGMVWLEVSPDPEIISELTEILCDERHQLTVDKVEHGSRISGDIINKLIIKWS